MSSYDLIAKDSFKVYPNPTQNSIHIESINPYLKIGRMIYENDKQSLSHTIDLSDYENGVYNVILYINNQPYVFRSIKTF